MATGRPKVKIHTNNCEKVIAIEYLPNTSEPKDLVINNITKYANKRPVILKAKVETPFNKISPKS